MDKSVKNFNVRLRTIRIRDLIVGIIIALILTFLVAAIFPVIENSEDLFYIVFLLFVALFFAWALKGTKGLDRNFEQIFEKDTKKEILIVFATNLLYAFLITFLISYLDIIVGIGDPNWISMWDVGTVSIDSSVIVLDAIGAIIFAPLIEELIFRGVLFNRLKIRTGIIPAIIISSFIFAIGHEFGGITSAFLFGICMCILYMKTDNILVPMTVHFINNLVATISSNLGIDSIVSQLPWILPATILTIIGTIYLIKYIIRESKSLKKQYG